MTRFAVLILALWGAVAVAQDATDTQSTEEPAETPAADTDSDAPVLDVRTTDGLTVEEFHWRNRLVIVFADSTFDPRFVEQMELLHALPEEMIERDVVVLTDTDPAEMSDIRTRFRPREFMLVLLGKDGAILLRKPFPWNVREISASIDKTPIRQQELGAPRG